VSHFIYQYAECRYAECRYAECRYAECHSAFSTLDFLPNLRMGPISLSVTLKWAGKACQGQAL
jgi:hypothetical protein